MLGTPEAERRRWMGLLARSDAERLRSLMDAAALACAHETLRGPETGLMMLRGRMGGTGGAFNIGEMTVTRCTVRLASGSLGHSLVGGRNHDHARNAALIDALLCEGAQKEIIMAAIIEPLAAIEAESAAARTAEAAATRVDFFTVSRGDTP